MDRSRSQATTPWRVGFISGDFGLMSSPIVLLFIKRSESEEGGSVIGKADDSIETILFLSTRKTRSQLFKPFICLIVQQPRPLLQSEL
ncbi:MAG: hypothetical protein NNA31_06165 [Nitrospira sp.]|nr:hypothetical protein [Nitrospira sp.]